MHPIIAHASQRAPFITKVAIWNLEVVRGNKPILPFLLLKFHSLARILKTHLKAILLVGLNSSFNPRLKPKITMALKS